MQDTHIYLEHFGLTARPFSLLPDPDFIYWSKHHENAYAMLEYGLMSLAPITVITGEIGAGKTTLLREFLRTAPPDYTIGLISNATGNRGELLHWVLMSLSQPVDPGASYVQLFHQFQSFLIEEYAQGRRTLLIFDEAQNLEPETLEELRMFSNINADQDELIQLVLFGQPQLRDLIQDPRLVQFAQRIAAEYHLDRMDLSTLTDYVRHRLAHVGAERDIFTPMAYEAVYLASRGTPRLVNQVCDFSLVYAAMDGEDEVSADTVSRVVQDRKDYGVFRKDFPKPLARKAGQG
ncbi:MAG: AAA family ATPase [Pseudomonadota bacterium]